MNGKWYFTPLTPKDNVMNALLLAQAQNQKILVICAVSFLCASGFFLILCLCKAAGRATTMEEELHSHRRVPLNNRSQPYVS